jgi:hypothetical protein
MDLGRTMQITTRCGAPHTAHRITVAAITRPRRNFHLDCNQLR